jgi:hypothetical protein
MRRRLAATAPLLAALAAGCGGPVDVQGKVLMDGKPLAKATVVFVPEEGGLEAGAVTDEEGSFRLSTSKSDGAKPGEYLVTVSKKDWPPGVTPPGPKELTFGAMAKMKEVVPRKYTSQERTPLRVTIPRGGVKDLVLEVKP